MFEMMKKTLSTMAAAAVLMASTAIAPAFAQTSTTTPNAPATTNSGTMNSTTGSAAPMTSAAASGEYITQQSATQMSANDYIGKAIYNAENNSIGDVNDLILEQDGGIVAAVVGVGGFLGIGEKDVAVPMSKLTMSRDENQNVRLTTTETADSLKAAPEFKTLSDQQAEMRSKSTDTTTTSSTGGAAPAGNTTAPATPARP